LTSISYSMKILKWFFRILGGLIALILIIGITFYLTSPQFGGKPTEEEISFYQQTGHYDEGFLNDEPADMEYSFDRIKKMVKEMGNPNPRVAPKSDVPVQDVTLESILSFSDSTVRLTWFGHSTFLVEMEGMKILFDPVFSAVPAPHPLLGRKRFNSQMPISIEELPPLDAVILSHDHYDHLDYASIDELREKTDHFFVPLGVDNHLEAWNIPDEKIHALDWWEESQLGDLIIALAPSRHFSGRGIGDQAATLWGSWVLKGEQSVYFSGDGGYGKHFKEIGEKYGPFDIGLMECGQYNRLWADIHMMPEQTAQAGLDIQADMIVPIHWGAFQLATHSWTDPVERVTVAASELGIPLVTPMIGEPITLGMLPYPNKAWWEEVE